MNQIPIVSVIITTKNEEKNIENCLRSVKAQTYPQDKIEIIVVDNNSTDKTKEIVKEFKERFTPLNVQLFNRGPERSAQRNFGVEKARGKYILYLDADMVLSEKVIEECVNKCENENYIALYIPERIVDYIDCLPREMPKAISWGIRVRDFERSFYNATVIDCVRFVRRDKFLEINGFDESLTGPEDWDFDRRIKETGKVDIINAPLYHNEESFNLRKYLEKKSYYAKSFNDYIEKWGKGDPIVKKQLGIWYRLFGVFTENGKWKKLLKYPLLTLGLYFLRLTVGIRYLLRV